MDTIKLDGKQGGLLIREARLRAGLSQQELGDRIGVSHHCISMWERCKRNPTIYTIARVAQALGCELEVELRWEH